MPPPAESLALPSYGGQAVIEGVMMRGTLSCAIAMRALTISANTQSGEDKKLDGPALFAAVVIPNPWDVGTARLLARRGFEALA
jgi:uncharacterized protein YqhQ